MAKTLCQPDKRNLEHGIDLNAMKDLLSQVPMSNKVPARTRELFDFARQVCLYGYYEYEFYSLCAAYLFLLTETAIRDRFVNELPDKCHLLRGKESLIVNRNYDIIMQRLWEGWVLVGFEEVGTSLWSILKWLKKNSVLPERIGKKEIELIRQLRSDTIHLRSIDAYAPTLIIPVLWKITDLLNCLYDPSVHDRDKEPKILKQQKESQKQMSQWLERVIKGLKGKDKEKDEGQKEKK